MLISLKRIVKSGWEKFSRDKSSSSAALFMMTIVLLVISALFFLQGASSFVLTNLQDAVDISTYLKDSAEEEEVSGLRQALESLPEVKEVTYVSKEEALEQFKETHKNDPVALEALEAVGQNPFLASLSIKAWDPNAYGAISDFLEGSAFSPVISNVDFHDRAPVIERLSRVASGIRTGVLAATLFIAIIAVLVAFNTIRLTIFSSREEIEVMRLVGASNAFIQGPFLMQGIIVGVLATLLSLLILFPVTMFLSLRLQSFLGQFNLLGYFFSHLPLVIGLQLAVGIGLGVVSSAIAIRKYIKI